MNPKNVKPILDPAIVMLDNGQKAELFIPDFRSNQELSIVPKRVMAHLVARLPKADMTTIIENFSVKAGDCSSLQDWLELLEEELEFHSSVNMLHKHFATLSEEEHARALVAR